MSYRILLCDDEIHILRAAEFKLTKAGYDVECANDGQEGWEAIQRRRPDILITDVQMPRMNGYELVQQVRDNSATRELPILMLTAKGYELTQFDAASKWGVAAVMTKPFSPRELVKMVEQTLAGRTAEVATIA
jgi:DNA-binding response OmpR family regulator